MSDLAACVATWRADAAALRRCGETRAAQLLERCAEEAMATDEAALGAWVPEARAVVRAGCDRRWFVRRRQEWAARGLARSTERGWEYRDCAIPLPDADARRLAS